MSEIKNGARLFAACVIAFLFIHCGSPVNADHPAFWIKPAHFPEPIYQFGANERNATVYELGRTLFYDPVLSLDSSISCASCHLQEFGFSDTLEYSFGIRNRPGIRNSPALANLAWNPHFMLDGGINHIEVMPIAPITDSVEMAIPLKTLMLRLNQNQKYKQAFKVAFKADSITDQHMLWSLAQFMAGLVSANNPYDAYIQSGEQKAMPASAQLGMHLFTTHCSSCHTPPLFTSFNFASNGTYTLGGDEGRFIITRDSADIGTYKIPSLRNIALTAPYMHDGRYKTIRQVLDHYTDSIAHRSDIHPFLHGGLSLTVADKEAIEAFLHQLTDTTYIRNPHFSNQGK